MINKQFLRIYVSGVMCLAGMCGAPSGAYSQQSVTIEQALDIAEEHNPTLINSKLNLERYQLQLVAQRASLKSRFSLNLDPIDYTKTRRFDNRLSQWYTNESLTSSGTFRVTQPILWTDGELSLINRFGWQNNTSVVEGHENRNKAFSNNLYLQFTQPVFTYNRRKMELKQIEFDYENAGIDYALQRLNTERDITNRFYTVYMAQSNLEIRKKYVRYAAQSSATPDAKLKISTIARIIRSRRKNTLKIPHILPATYSALLSG